jgi:hypothetical protein
VTSSRRVESRGDPRRDSRQGAGLIVLPIDGALASNEGIIDLLMELDAPILLARDVE